MRNEMNGTIIQSGMYTSAMIINETIGLSLIILNKISISGLTTLNLKLTYANKHPTIIAAAKPISTLARDIKQIL